MANWQRTIRLQPEWDQARDGEITFQALAAAILKRLRAIKPFKAELDDLNEELADVVLEFECLAKDPDATGDDVDEAMRALYDWGDQRLDGDWNGKKVCWVDTMTRVNREVTA